MQRLLGAAVPLFAALAAFAIGAIVMVVAGANPVDGFLALFSGAAGSGSRLATTAVVAAPLLLVGAGITIAFRASVINIGGEGQIIAGALLSASVALAVPDLPAIILIPLIILSGAIGGGIWGAIPGALKAYASVNEILSTIMLNIVALQLMNYLLRTWLIDPVEVANGTRSPHTARLSKNAEMPALIPGSRLHLGVLIAVLFAVAVYVLLWRTPLGFKLRAVGHSPDAARAAGIPVKRSIVTALGLSGALCGVAGTVLVFGSEGVRLSEGFTGSAGFNGIVAALFGSLHPLWTIPSSFLFGGLLTGSTNLQLETQVPQSLAVALNGLVVIFVVSSTKFRKRMDELAQARSEFNEVTDG